MFLRPIREPQKLVRYLLIISESCHNYRANPSHCMSFTQYCTIFLIYTDKCTCAIVQRVRDIINQMLKATSSITSYGYMLEAPNFPTTRMSRLETSTSCSLSPQLYAMPARDLVRQDLVHHLVLLNDAQALELGRLNAQRIHRATTTTDILDLEEEHQVSSKIPSGPRKPRKLHMSCRNTDSSVQRSVRDGRRYGSLHR